MRTPIKKFLLMTLTSLILTSCGQSSGFDSFDGSQVTENSWFSNDPSQPNLSHETLATINNKTTLLIDKEQIFPEIYKLIDQAKKTIYITTYLFGDSIGHKIAEKLIAKKKEGVEIQFVIEETLGTIAALADPAKKELKFLAQNGIFVKAFPVNLLPKGPTFLSNQKVINHAKMVLVDGSSVIMGGMNFKDTEAINHDYMVKIEGPAASELAKIDNVSWQKATKLMKIKAFDDTIQTEPVGVSNVEIGQTGFTEQSIPQLLIRHFNNAKSSIEIEMLLMDHQEVIQSLVAAKQRGVDVRVILDQVDPGKYAKILEKLPLEGMANFGSVMTLLDAGISVRWYVPKIKDQMLHAKVALVDNQTFMVGSANYTYHALTRNHEIAVAVTDPSIANTFAPIFEQDWASHSQPAQLKKSQRFLGKLFQKLEHYVYQNRTEEQIKAENPEIKKAIDDVIKEEQVSHNY